jgi:hypothetical protein
MSDLVNTLTINNAKKAYNDAMTGKPDATLSVGIEAALEQFVKDCTWDESVTILKSFSKEIDESKPDTTEEHKLYSLAFDLVSQRHGKFELVHLVFWLISILSPIQQRLMLAQANDK